LNIKKVPQIISNKIKRPYKLPGLILNPSFDINPCIEILGPITALQSQQSTVAPHSLVDVLEVGE
jgi:hypothetical protein